ncbi:MAG: DUF4252 domain-containing protein [Bacteroidetes bacterium]|jgi:hypothetical protein|nr:DUF4252 domain-containing protein [Bacteroidota bacterium]
MKTLKTQVFILAMFILPFAAFSQGSSIDKLYEKYSGKEGITSINLSAEMFKLAAGFASSGKSNDSKDVNDVINQINGMKILVLKDSLLKSKSEFKEDLQRLANTKDLVELMSILEKGTDVRFLTKKNRDNSYSEVLMISKGKTETIVMSFTGNIKPETLGKLSRTMNIDGMENFEKLEKK